MKSSWKENHASAAGHLVERSRSTGLQHRPHLWKAICPILIVAVLLPSTVWGLPQNWCPNPSPCTGMLSDCGEWSGPHNLGISCPNTVCCDHDEIAHASLIPTGTHKGRVLVWTRCDDQPTRGAPLPSQCNSQCAWNTSYAYKSHVVNVNTSTVPVTLTVAASPSFGPALPGDPSLDTELDGPFCSGHTWMLDSAGNPKLLVVGGGYYGTGLGSRETYWFDPATAVWVDGPGQLPDPSWYPSVITFLDETLDPDRFRPIALGGTRTQQGGISEAYIQWWTMSLDTNTWSPNTPMTSYKWHDYPRAMFVNTAPQRELVTAGHDVLEMNGGNPCQKIITSAITPTQIAGFDPNPTGCNVGVAGCVLNWNSNNAVIMHTLKQNPPWMWTTDPVAALAQYDQNRIIGMMGAQLNSVGDPGLFITLELTPTGWMRKNDPGNPPRGRVFSNAVLLPDMTILVVGGQTEQWAGGEPGMGADNCYYGVADRLDPQEPPTGTPNGIWTKLAAAPLISGTSYGTPRGYHSCAVLLADASVLLMGGVIDSTGSLSQADSEDSADHFKPPYFFKGTRPVLINVPGTIRYGQTFCLTQMLQSGQPHPVVRFCLIGVGSVTHHFDYGQRYIELMHQSPGSCVGGLSLIARPIELLGPPTAAMAPEGYYLLFGVDDRGVPSVGHFVKVTF